MYWVDYETLRESLKSVCKTYNLHESIIESVFQAISEKKKQYLENIRNLNEIMSFLRKEFQETDDKGKVGLAALQALMDQGFSEENARIMIKIAKAGEKI